jgi:hypothetical protein
MYMLRTAAVTSVFAASVASACTVCGWSPTTHVLDGSSSMWQETADAYNAQLRPGQTPIGGLDERPGLVFGGGTQQVWLDFTQAPAGVFSTVEQQAIEQRVRTIYDGFDVSIGLDQPAGNATQISFVTSSGGPFGSDLGGVADEIDFRNVNQSNTAFVFTGGLANQSSNRQVRYAANVAAHELGHTLGLRHYDAFGPIGQGVPSTNLANDFAPSFPGPVTTSNEYDLNVMSTPAFGANGEAFFTGDASLSVRSSIKLSFAEQGILETEVAGDKSSIATAQELSLIELDVPNGRPIGAAFADQDLPARAAAVTGAITSTDQLDFYSFDGTAGTILSLEVMSVAISQRFSNTLDPNVRLFDASGELVDYFGTPADNDDEVESGGSLFDSWLFDLVLPEDGTYFVEIGTSRAFPDFNPTGSYELFVTNFGSILPDLLPGDANGDGVVNLADFGILRANFGSTGASFATGDFNGDGLVNLADFGILRANFGNSTPTNLSVLDDFYASVIPEPAAACAAGLLGLLLIRRR